MISSKLWLYPRREHGKRIQDIPKVVRWTCTFALHKLKESNKDDIDLFFYHLQVLLSRLKQGNKALKLVQSKCFPSSVPRELLERKTLLKGPPKTKRENFVQRETL